MHWAEEVIEELGGNNRGISSDACSWCKPPKGERKGPVREFENLNSRTGPGY